MPPDDHEQLDASRAQGLKRHVPNALTVLRLALAGVFVALLSAVTPSPPSADAGAIERLDALSQDATILLVVAAGIFVFASLTDALDGMLARKWSVVSRFGRVLDPTADKILVLGAFVLLAGPALNVWWGEPVQRVNLSGVEPWMVVLILARELLVTAIRAVYEAEGADFSAGWSGKAKMVCQSLAVPIILLTVAFAPPLPGTSARTGVVAVAWATTAITVISGWPYVSRAIRMTARAARPAPAVVETPAPPIGPDPESPATGGPAPQDADRAGAPAGAPAGPDEQPDSVPDSAPEPGPGPADPPPDPPPEQRPEPQSGPAPEPPADAPTKKSARRTLGRGLSEPRVPARKRARQRKRRREDDTPGSEER